MRYTLTALAILFVASLLGACTLNRNHSGTSERPGGNIVLEKWEGFGDSTKFEPLDARMQPLAVDAEMTYLRRLRGDGPTMFDDSFLANCVKQVYVLSDQAIKVTEGSPHFVMAQNIDELERLARESKKDIFYIELKTLGQTTVKGKKGVAISYNAFVVDWQQAEWAALPASEKEGKPTPQFRVWLYACSVQAFVTRTGNKLLVLEGPMIVS